MIDLQRVEFSQIVSLSGKDIDFNVSLSVLFYVFAYGQNVVRR